MKKIQLITLFSAFVLYVNAQTNYTINQKIYNADLHSNLFKISMTEPLTPDYETSAILCFNYERKLIGAFTSVSKIGFGISVKNFNPKNGENGQYSFHVVGSEELRYYFNLMRKIRKEKYVKNYSAPYISLEQIIFSNAIGLINQTSKHAVQGSMNTFLNLGFQAQSASKKIYINAYFGVLLGGKSLSKFYDDGQTHIHGGLGIGYVF